MATVPFKVKAIYEYVSNHEDDLPFQVGQVITVTDEEDTEWYGGEYVDGTGVKQEGIFPRNFVEKFEPTAPPRPIRTRKKDQESAPPAPPSPPSPPPVAVAPAEQPVEEAPAETPVETPAETPAKTPVEDVREETLVITPQAPLDDQSRPPEAPAVPVANPPEIAPAPAPAPIETKDVDSVGSPSVDAPLPTEVSASGASSLSSTTPFKPSGLGSGSSGFIKKPFVAPPPSRHAYVPPPRDTNVARIYRREEDPKMKETQAESVDATEKPKPIPAASSEPQEEDQPKPTTLKERIALLQRQQAEAAQRHVEAVAKKEKPARPPKKRIDSEGPRGTPVEDQATGIPPPLDRRDSADVTSKDSLDESRSAMQSLNISRVSTAPVENDGNEADMSGAGDTTEDQEDLTGHDDSDEKPENPTSHEAAAPEEQAPGEDEVEDEDDIDPEIRRKEELRARMAKMSGGMGMAVMALPGMGKQKQPEETHEPEPNQDAAEEETTPSPIPNSTSLEPKSTSQATEGLPPVPTGRPAPPSIPTDSRPPPPPPPAGVVSPSIGSESDDEMSESTSKLLETPRAETSPTSRGPPPIPMASPPLPTSPRFSSGNRSSYVGEEMSPASPASSPQQSKRNSRPPPPIPGVAPPAPTQTRPPPPLPPSTTLSRASTADQLIGTPMKPGRLDNGEEGEVTEYEGDYDTDIASSAHHKDALKSHARGSSFEDNSSVRSPATEFPPAAPPPVPSSTTPRAGPPPIPTPLALNFKTSADIPRAMPPPNP
ncbi:hypothetical protein CIB48_g938 [Xylaria polymorpha]|nr:hypothetical protein CIB48_g938 [Xylaria polymorpha]